MRYGELLLIFKYQWFLLVGFQIEFDCILLCQMCFNAFDKNADLNVMDHPILNFIYYLVSFFFVLLNCGYFTANTLLFRYFVARLVTPFWSSWNIGCGFMEDTNLNTTSPLITIWDATELKGRLLITVSSYCSILNIIYLGVVIPHCMEYDTKMCL